MNKIDGLAAFKSTIAILLFAYCSAAFSDESRPNILFVLSDDHRWDLLGYSHPIIKTPTLDGLANKGVVFNNAFVTTPICAASRASIVTGLTERTHDYTFRQPAVTAEDMATAYPAKLKQIGYYTGFVGKFGFKIAEDSAKHFDYFESLRQAKTHELNGQTLAQPYYMAALVNQFIEKAAKQQQPWMMSVSFWNPHAHDRDKDLQYHYPAEFEEMYQDVEIPPAKLSADSNFANLPDFIKESIARQRWEYRFGTEEIYQKMVKRHYRAISSVDAAIGRIVASIEQAGMADNTIIIYTGDNGYFVNERQLAGKWFGWDQALRVPLIVFDPRMGLKERRDVNELVLNIDIAPTLLSFAGIAQPARYQGYSLAPLLDGKATPNWRNEFFFEHMFQPNKTAIPPTIGVRTTDFKYVDFYKHNYRQLYDLKNDPDESVNLANEPEYKKMVADFKQKTDHYITTYEQARSDDVKKRQAFVNARDTQF